MVYTTRNDFASGEPLGFAVPRRISIAGASASRSPAMVLTGKVKVSCTPSPDCTAARSVTATGMLGEGATGSPGAPQPATNTTAAIQIGIAKNESGNTRREKANQRGSEPRTRELRE